MQDAIAHKPKEGDSWDVVVVGSGPAGLTAAIYTTRGAASTLVVSGSVWGGQLMLTSTVDNFPGFPEGIEGPNLIAKMRTQAERFGALFIDKDVTAVNLSKYPFELDVSGEKITTKSIIIATGAETVWLDAPGIKELIGKGVSSCAPCDAPFFVGKKVVVVGGGDSAMEEALVLTKYAIEVTIVHRRDSFRASQVMQQKVLSNPKIKILWDTEIVQARGETKLTSLVLKNNKTKEQSELVVDGLFVAIGHNPQSSVFSKTIDIDEKQFIKRVDPFSSKTNINGVFVAGDVHDSTYKQAVTAAGFGCQSGMDALKFLEEKR